MKKIIGSLGVVIIAVAMFFNTNVTNNSTEDTSLTSLIGLNSANAEEYGGITIGSTDCTCSGSTCQDANWISFRTNCGNVNGTSTDGACKIVHPNAC